MIPAPGPDNTRGSVEFVHEGCPQHTSALVGTVSAHGHCTVGWIGFEANYKQALVVTAVLLHLGFRAAVFFRAVDRTQDIAYGLPAFGFQESPPNKVVVQATLATYSLSHGFSPSPRRPAVGFPRVAPVRDRTGATIALRPSTRRIRCLLAKLQYRGAEHFVALSRRNPEIVARQSSVRHRRWRVMKLLLRQNQKSCRVLRLKVASCLQHRTTYARKCFPQSSGPICRCIATPGCCAGTQTHNATFCCHNPTYPSLSTGPNHIFERRTATRPQHPRAKMHLQICELICTNPQ